MGVVYTNREIQAYSHVCTECELWAPSTGWNRVLHLNDTNLTRFLVVLRSPTILSAPPDHPHHDVGPALDCIFYSILFFYIFLIYKPDQKNLSDPSEPSAFMEA